MDWVLVEREQFVRMCEKLGVSTNVREAIKFWAPSVRRCETTRQKLAYRSPKNRYEAWVARIPNPDVNKGKSGGYRIVFFLDITERSINLDFIEERDHLGFKNESIRKKQKYNDYIANVKKELSRRDPLE